MKFQPAYAMVVGSLRDMNNQNEINVTTIKELVVYAQQQYNNFGWRVTYTYRKQLIE